MYSKKAVSDSFSRFSSTYDDYAEAQAMAASLLGEFIKDSIGETPCGPVLEIGCGTGFVTREIFRLFPDRTFLITDIAAKMAEICREHLAALDINCDNALFASYDGESNWPENRFSMVFSGFTFQWFTNFEKSLLSLYRSLVPGGILAFSFQSEGSFSEWEEACNRLDIPFTANQLPSIDEVSKFFSGFGIKSTVLTKFIPVNYRSSADFFRAIKRIGAGTMNREDHLSPALMKKLIKGWDEMAGKNLTVTYMAGLFFIKK
ncbi:methyltransferase [Desulforegula conservatrix]|uniref:methyltransferase n=1 Tax=Desulforegula conservatrix TaxID=153026 RepID=UPI000412AFE0|nr:methyltransferase [Desulforegula conservatrix]